MANIFGFYCFEPWQFWLIIAGCSFGGLLLGIVLSGSKDYSKVSEKRDRLCMKCGSFIFEDETICPNCGMKYVDDYDHLMETEETEPIENIQDFSEANSKSELHKCSVCGKVVFDGEKKCPYCR